MSRYTVYVVPQAWNELQVLPGHVPQRIRRAISALADTPRPNNSKALTLLDITVEVRRIRLDRWRIIYIVTDQEQAIDVVAVRKRPPYDYGDIAQLLASRLSP
jgi:mRNA-degrading endonuclease RelE of RelBE toxin-antitoxin system